MHILGSVQGPLSRQRICYPIKRLNFVEHIFQFQLPRCLPGKPDFVSGQIVNLYKAQASSIKLDFLEGLGYEVANLSFGLCFTMKHINLVELWLRCRAPRNHRPSLSKQKNNVGYMVGKSSCKKPATLFEAVVLRLQRVIGRQKPDLEFSRRKSLI